MKYESRTTFEILRPIPGQPIQKVPSDCNSITFIALPARTLNGENFNFTSGNGYESFLEQAPRINGIVLMPMVVAPESLTSSPNADNRQQSGDRLEFTNLPGVIDRTIYDVQMTYEVAFQTNAIVALMVVRRFITPVS